MSKNFPYIRYHGNAEAGVRHTKRGMYELFRAQELQERMGVPIYKRSVEVDEYTTITVQISMEQTFVHIYSNPPQVPDVTVEMPKKETPEASGCPSLFLIRSVPEGTSGINFGDDQDGYLIGYDHGTRKWKVMRIYNDGVELTTPLAGNLGWYHARDSADGLFTHCDIVSWHGQSAPDFHPAVLPGRRSGSYPAATLLKRRVYFQGREYTTNQYVVGACILQAKDSQNQTHDYLYTHEIFVVDTPLGNAVQDMRINYESFRRRKLSDLISGVAGSWESLKSVTAEDFAGELSFYLPVQTTPYFAHPRTTAYVDKDGYSYVTREYPGFRAGTTFIEDNLIGNRDGYTAFIKFNMRDGTWEILSSTETRSPSFTLAHSWSKSCAHVSDVGINDGTQPYEASLQVRSDAPWTFYVWPGTEDLYTLSLEHRYDVASNDFEAVYLTEPVTRYLYTGMGYCAGDTQLLLHKNDKLVSSEAILSIDSNNSYEYVPTAQAPLVFGASGYTNATSFSVYEWHPEIPKSRHTFTYDTRQEAGGPRFATIDWDDGDQIRRVYSHDGPPPNPHCDYTVGLDGRGTWGLSQFSENRIDNGCTLSETNLHDGEDTMSFRASDWLPGTIGLGGGWYYYFDQPNLLGTGMTCLGFSFGTEDYRNMAVGGQTVDSRRVEGGVLNFIVPSRDDPEDDTRWWAANSYAIHKEVNGMKPYLWLRRKLYPSSSYFDYVNTLTIRYSDMVLAEEDPGVSWPSPYDSPSRDQEEIILWAKPIGSFYNVAQGLERNWDSEELVLESNFIDAGTLNKLTKELGNAFFNIGII